MDATLGKRIAANRKRLGLTQDQLAEKLGITAQAVSKWENDLSCPDITMLPKLADIFETTTDALLGRETVSSAIETEVITDIGKRENGFTYDSDKGEMDFHWKGAKLEGIGLACWVILTGIVYLLAQLLSINVSFWNILWPTSILVFGLFGLFSRFSAFRLGCALAGGYFLAEKLHLLQLSLNSGIIVAVIVLLFGVGLLADTLRKNKKHRFSGSYADENGKIHHGKATHDYNVDGTCFTFDANFGSSTQAVVIDKLSRGSIDTNFGEYTVDLSGVTAVDSDCRLSADCNFGELHVLVPRRYTVIPDSSTSFASFNIQGQPSGEPQGTIRLEADVTFGEITVVYI